MTLRPIRQFYSSMFCWTPSLAFVASILLPAVAAHATDITTCGVTIAAGDTGVLQNDLDCSSSLVGVRLLRKATLDLNGHAIAGSTSTFATVLGVAMINDDDPGEGGKGDFTIKGPGEISGVVTDPHNFVGTRGCVVLQNGRAVITSATGMVDIHGCIFGVVGYLYEYSTSKARATLDHVTLHDNVLEGVTVAKLVVSNVTSYNNGGIGVHAISTMVATDVFAHDNGIGLFATRKLRGTNVTASGNGRGFSGRGVSSFGSVDLDHLVANDNGLFGVDAIRVRIVDSTLSGNMAADFRSDKPPLVANTTCGSSLRRDGQGSWGVCAND